MSDRNIFGGGNRKSLYTPMSEDEQEVLSRLVEADDLEVHVKQWGVVNKFNDENGAPCKPRFGDKVLELKFWVKFSKPDVLIPVHYFDLELRTRAGRLLFAERQPIKGPDGGPLMCGAGVTVPLGWYIGIHKMDPQLVRDIKPGARGLTTREGNRKLTESVQAILAKVRKAEQGVRDARDKEAEEAAKKSVY